MLVFLTLTSVSSSSLPLHAVASLVEVLLLVAHDLVSTDWDCWYFMILLVLLAALLLVLRSVSISFLHFAVVQWLQTAVNNSKNDKKRKLIEEKTYRN